MRLVKSEESCWSTAAVYLDPAAFHLVEDGDQRAFECFIDGGAARLDQLALQERRAGEG